MARLPSFIRRAKAPGGCEASSVRRHKGRTCPLTAALLSLSFDFFRANIPEHRKNARVYIEPGLEKQDLASSAFASFVGMYPIPLRYGMTVGELALMFNSEFGINAALKPACSHQNGLTLRRRLSMFTGLNSEPASALAGCFTTLEIKEVFIVRRLCTVVSIVGWLVASVALPASSRTISMRAGDTTGQVQTLPKGVSVYELNNGLKVLLIVNPALPMVGANVVVKIGSSFETFSTSGMSHMLEHLLFNGTTSRPQKQLYDDVDRIGGYNNASTAEFYTNFMMVTPAENIKKGMEIQADMLFNSILPAEKFEKEKGIVLEEISKSLADPQEQLERNTLSVLFNGHALSLPTLGTYSTIQSLSRDAVNSFYKNNYVPNNMILSVIGNFRTSTMLPLIKEIYGKARPGQVRREEDPEWATGYQAPTLSARRNTVVYHRFYDGEDNVLQVFFQLPQSQSSEYFQLLNVVIDKNKDAIQSSLKSEFGQNLKSLKLSTRLTHLSNVLEATMILKAGTGFDALVASLSAKLAGLSFSMPPEAVRSEVTRSRTEFGRNIEKPLSCFPRHS